MNERNVLNGPLASCGTDPMTGFRRDGCCSTQAHDAGLHVVCAKVTQEFLEFSRVRGNDLITPRAEWNFPGLRAGDRWCLCANRWKEALEAGIAPPVILEATHMRALSVIDLVDLRYHAYCGDANDGRDA